MLFFAQLLANVTGKPRYFPEIVWSTKSWTHNVFRAYEYIFGRRTGIRAEASVWRDEEGNQFHACHSVESAIAFAESAVRSFFRKPRLAPFKIYIPMLQTPMGIPVFASPYLFAIAYGSTGSTGELNNANAWTASLTNSGSSVTDVLTMRWWSNSGSQSISNVRYNGVDMTLIDTKNDGSDNNYRSTSYYLTDPATGANNAVVNFSAASYGEMGISSFSGTNTASVFDASSVGNNYTSTTSVTSSILTGYANSMIVDAVGTANGNVTSFTSGQTSNWSTTRGASGRLLTTTTGVYSMTWTMGTADGWGQVLFAMRASASTVIPGRSLLGVGI